MKRCLAAEIAHLCVANLATRLAISCNWRLNMVNFIPQFTCPRIDQRFPKCIAVPKRLPGQLLGISKFCLTTKLNLKLALIVSLMGEKEKISLVNLAKLIILSMLLTSTSASADLFDQMGKRYEVPPRLLRSISGVESNTHPWTFNISGEPFFFETKNAALEWYRSIDHRPWLLETIKDSEATQRLFASAASARLYARQEGSRINLLKRLSANETAVGLMQIYWSIHRNKVPSFERLLDPDFNIAYGASFLAGLIEEHGTIEAIGRYYGGTTKQRQKYKDKVLQRYRNLMTGKWKPAAFPITRNSDTSLN